MFEWSRNKVKWCLFSLWSIITLTLISHHAFWMDEVINLIFGIGADSHYGIHGNGHPAVWFILLRGLYAIFHKVWVLPLASFLVAATAVWLFLFKSPFSLRFKILFLCSNFALYEYVVMARNYGISMLFMFILAIIASNKQVKNKFTGPCLVILNNTNIHSSLLSLSYLLGLIAKSLTNKATYRKENFKFLLKISIYNIIGMAICFATIFPTFDTVASKQLTQNLTLRNAWNSIIISKSFNKITYFSYFGDKENSKIQNIEEIYGENSNDNMNKLLIDDHKCMEEYLLKKYTERCLFSGGNKIKIFFSKVFRFLFIVFSSALIYVSVFSFWGEVDLFSSAIFGLLFMDLFSSFVYKGGYRHQALWLVFMVMLLWISKNENLSFDNKSQIIRKFGKNSFVMLMILQVWPSISNIYNETFAKPNSNSRLFSQFINKNIKIKNSAIISNDDLILEGMHYYIDNPTFIMSERKFNLIFPFSESEYSSYSLDDVLDSANIIAFCNNVPVLILLASEFNYQQRVSPESITHPTLYRYDYLNFYIDNKQLARLQAETQKIATFKEALLEPEFSVYKLSPRNAQVQSSCPSQYIFDRKIFHLDGRNIPLFSSWKIGN